MPQHMIEEVFGQGCDLYKLLKCNADATKAQLRKGYYRAALKVHPDKNTNNDLDTTKQFQAISMVYQILQDETLRQEYDETGVIPDTSNDNDADNDDMTGRDAWKSYFDQIFGKVTTSKIDSFAAKYKCSDEEKRDVLREFKSRKGNLVKMLDFVMLSEPRDAIRWVEDYIRPAFYNKTDNNNSSSNDNDNTTDADKKDAAAWKTTMEKTLTKLQKQVEKENQKQSAAAAAANDQDDDDDDNSMQDEGETETEDEDEEVETPQKKSSKKKQASSRKSTGSSNKSSSAKRAKPLQAKHAKKTQKTNSTKKNNNNKNQQGSSSMDDLIAQIQNKRRGGGSSSNAWADLSARYGVANEDADNDPLNDDEFAKIQAGLGNNKKKKSKGKR